MLEGLSFYELGRLAAADTRVKVTFEELGRRKRDELARLEAVLGTAAKDAATMPGIFPMDAVSKVECYVCGYVTDTKALPDQCPKCGTARYTFEKEIARAKAWEIAGESARRTAALFRDAASRGPAKARAVLEDLAKQEDDLAQKAGREVAELRK